MTPPRRVKQREQQGRTAEFFIKVISWCRSCNFGNSIRDIRKRNLLSHLNGRIAELQDRYQERRLWLMFESLYTSTPAKQVRSHFDPYADFCADTRLPFLPMNPFRSLLHSAQTLVANTPPNTDQQSSLQSP